MKASCLYCKTEFSFSPSQRRGKYCSNDCRGKYQTEQNVFGPDPKNKAVRRYVLENWEYKCSVCGITEWNEQPIALQLDHINGDCKDHRLENRRWTCPNCHSQTPTWGVANVSPEGRERLRAAGKWLANGCQGTVV